MVANGTRPALLNGGVKCRAEMEQGQVEWEAAWVVAKVRVVDVKAALLQVRLECVFVRVAGRPCRISVAHHARALVAPVADLR